MKILSCALLLMASMAFVLLGCSDNSGPIVAPKDQVLSSPTSSTDLAKCGVKVINSLRGSANNWYALWYSPDGTELWGTMPDPKGRFYTVETFEADAYSNGTASGSFHYNFLGKLPKGVEAVGGWGKFEGKVIKLAVEGNKAFVVVEVKNWKSTSLPGWFAQVFIDNGKRASSRDEVSEWFTTQLRSIADDPTNYWGSRELWLGMGPKDFIEWTKGQLAEFPLPVLFSIDHGNIQVR